MAEHSARSQRVRHFQGQRLHGADLQDEYENLAWLRSLHVVAQHDTWGIALGLDVRHSLGDDVHDDVQVGPGVAYDCFGREIVLGQMQIVPHPFALFEPAAGMSLTLVISHPSEGDRAAAPDVLAPCPGASGGAQSARPVLAWRWEGEVRLGREVPLIGFATNADSTPSFDTSVRRYTQALSRPHVYAALTGPEQPWTPWRVTDQQLQIGIETWVDTSDAGFVGTPHYLASLQTASTLLAADTDNALVGRFPAIFTTVVDASPTGFRFRFTAAVGPHQVVALAVNPRHRAGGPFSWLRISWLGVEPAGGCSPNTGFLSDDEWSKRRRFREMRRTTERQRAWPWSFQSGHGGGER